MKEKDVISLDYDLWLVESDELYDTTREETAKEHELFDENKTYEPIKTIVGAGRLIKGLEISLLEAEVGKEYEVEIPPQEAYGERDSKLVEVHSVNEIRRIPELRKKDIEPYVGMELIYKNRPAYISSMTASRVRVDFNHRLAGRTLKYKYVIVEKFDGDERIKAVLESDYGRAEDFKVEADGEKVSMVLPEICKVDQQWLISKYKIVSDLRDILGFSEIRFIEEYVKKEPEPEKEPATQPTSPEDSEPVEEGKPSEETKPPESSDGGPVQEEEPKEADD